MDRRGRGSGVVLTRYRRCAPTPERASRSLACPTWKNSVEDLLTASGRGFPSTMPSDYARSCRTLAHRSLITGGELDLEKATWSSPGRAGNCCLGWSSWSWSHRGGLLEWARLGQGPSVLVGQRRWWTPAGGMEPELLVQKVAEGEQLAGAWISLSSGKPHALQDGDRVWTSRYLSSRPKCARLTAEIRATEEHCPVRSSRGGGWAVPGATQVPPGRLRFWPGRDDLRSRRTLGKWASHRPPASLRPGSAAHGQMLAADERCGRRRLRDETAAPSLITLKWGTAGQAPSTAIEQDEQTGGESSSVPSVGCG